METDNSGSSPVLSGACGSLRGGDDSLPQGIFLPVVILMVSVLLFLGWQLYLAKMQGSIWQKQMVQREQLVSQSRAVQADLQRIAADLMTLAVTDADARVIVEKYQIRQDPKPQAAAAKP